MRDLFIVDNGDKNWKAKNYLHEWLDLAHTFHVVTGYFETGVLDEVIEAHGGWPLVGSIKEQQEMES